jgi:glycosyltransferase involved in cell wall biosynthesis
MKITFLLWGGFIGGAERLTASLAAEVRAQGTAADILFVCKAQPLSAQLERNSVPFHALGYSRGAHVLRHPRALSRAVRDAGADIAVVGSFGYLGGTLRAGGFRGPILGVEHGVLHEIPSMPLYRQAVRRVDRALGVATHDAEIAVSRYMEALARTTLHGRRLVRIPHGVTPAESRMASVQGDDEVLTVGYAGRLDQGKGVDVLLHAFALGRDRPRPRLRLAGDGPTRASLETLASRLGVGERVEFLGWSDDINRFWDECDIAVAPASEVAESFSMTTLEAMARGRATIVTDRGALPELVIAGQSGTIVPPQDAQTLANAIDAYAQSPETVTSHGQAAMLLARDRFSLAACARSYIRLAAELIESRQSHARH